MNLTVAVSLSVMLSAVMLFEPNEAHYARGFPVHRRDWDRGSHFDFNKKSGISSIFSKKKEEFSISLNFLSPPPKKKQRL